jgi:hypothetical protein
LRNGCVVFFVYPQNNKHIVRQTLKLARKVRSAHALNREPDDLCSAHWT